MKTITVVDYDPAWPQTFELLRSRIWAVVSHIATAVEHIGSTAVPGLASKPVIDIDVVVAAESDIAAAIQHLATIGYGHRGNLGVAGREAFTAPAALPRHHLYLCPAGSPALANHLAVRDHLRAHPDVAAEYGALKKQLAVRFAHDSEGYTAGKTTLLLRVLREAGCPVELVNDVERANRGTVCEMPNHDASAGYESAAGTFQSAREQARVGADTIASWAQTLPPGTEVLELGCGAGVPVTQELARAGCVVWGIDASPTLLARFTERFPEFECACHDLATSTFFSRTFDAAVAVGVLFLLPPDIQRDVIARVAARLRPGGWFLFTSPASAVQWTDVLTGHRSQSLGTAEYIATLHGAGLTRPREFEDEGGNHYFLARRDGEAEAVR